MTSYDIVVSLIEAQYVHARQAELSWDHPTQYAHTQLLPAWGVLFDNQGAWSKILCARDCATSSHTNSLIFPPPLQTHTHTEMTAVTFRCMRRGLIRE